jgi:hypothetical protein
MTSSPAFRNAGFAFVSVGIAELGVAVFAHQPVFYGVAPAMIAIGVVFIARRRALLR